MRVTKNEIKNWMKENNLERAWLAKECGVSKATVDAWLSSDRGVPSKAQLTIQTLIFKITCRLRGWRISKCNSPRCGTMRRTRKKDDVVEEELAAVLEHELQRIERVYLDFRRPSGVIFASRLRDDLSRRDFTVNAMEAPELFDV